MLWMAVTWYTNHMAGPCSVGWRLWQWLKSHFLISTSISGSCPTEVEIVISSRIVTSAGAHMPPLDTMSFFTVPCDPTCSRQRNYRLRARNAIICWRRWLKSGYCFVRKASAAQLQRGYGSLPLKGSDSVKRRHLSGILTKGSRWNRFVALAVLQLLEWMWRNSGTVKMTWKQNQRTLMLRPHNLNWG